MGEKKVKAKVKIKAKAKARGKTLDKRTRKGPRNTPALKHAHEAIQAVRKSWPILPAPRIEVKQVRLVNGRSSGKGTPGYVATLVDPKGRHVGESKVFTQRNNCRRFVLPIQEKYRVPILSVDVLTESMRKRMRKAS